MLPPRNDEIRQAFELFQSSYFFQDDGEKKSQR